MDARILRTAFAIMRSEVTSDAKGSNRNIHSTLHRGDGCHRADVLKVVILCKNEVVI